MRSFFRFLYSGFFIQVFLSCGNSEEAKLPSVNADSVPPDLSSINAAIEKDRNNPELYFKRAHYFLANKKIQDAFTDMAIVLKIDSAQPRYYLFLSDLYLTQNQTRDTRDMLRKAIRLDTSNKEALKKYSELFFLLRQYDTAMFYINRCLHYDKSNAGAHFQKGMILKEAGDTAKAISCFQDAVKYNQQHYNAFMQLGLLFSVKKNPLALEYLQNALSIDPRSTEALYMKGSFLQNTGNYEEAIKVYGQILQISPEHADAAFNTAACLFEQKKFDEAIKKFDEILKRDANFFRAYYAKGRCLEEMGDRQQALDQYKRCLAIKPDYQLAISRVDVITKRKG